MENLSKYLSHQESEEEGEIYDFLYRGSSEIDRHYTKPMLPWIISEIKNQHKLLQVTVTIKNGSFEVKDKETTKVILTHTVKQIHKCVMEQGDHRCFLYTLRSPTKTLSPAHALSDFSCTPLPSNIPVNQNYQCHLYQALTEQELFQVRSFFGCLRQQPREAKMVDNDSANALADLSVHTESQFFEVLFVGRVKVSHCKVPVTFIDEAIVAFKQKEKNRQRHTSGEGVLRSSPNRLMTFQQEGSGYSVPNIVLRNLCEGNSHHRSRSGSRELTSGESVTRKDREPRVRFNLGSSVDSTEDSADYGSPVGGSSPQSSVSSSSSSSRLRMDLKELESERESNPQGIVARHLLRGGSADADFNSGYAGEHRSSLTKLEEDPDTIETDLTAAAEEPCIPQGIPQLLAIEPFRQRYRTNSTSDAGTPTSPLVDTSSQMSEQNTGMRSRSGSMGSAMARNKNIKMDSDLKALGYDFNRTMLFHIGHREIQLINPELKSVQLHKPFKDIAGCCQGMKSGDHFGFICRELSGDTMVYVGYIFRCDKSSVADEIMQVMNRSFSAMHEAHQKERKEHLMCDFCPLKWFSQLCAEVEGLAAAKAHSVIMRRVSSLPEEEREIIIAKYEGAETSETAQKNNVLMMLLRTHFEYKQMNHSHPSESDFPYQRSESLLGANLEESLKKAKKSIATSFNHLLKKREGDSAEREIPKPVDREKISPHRYVVEHPRISPTRASPEKSLETSPKTSTTGGNSYVLEGISDSPLRTLRSRSSTISGAGADSIRKELMAQKAILAKREQAEERQKREMSDRAQSPSRKNSGPKMNIFLKFGAAPHSEETFKDTEAVDSAKPLMSFRQSILQKVVSPTKGMPEPCSNRKVSAENRKISTGRLGPHDKSNLAAWRKRSTEELMILWKKAIFQQILLLRIEKENQRLRAFQKEVALQRVRLNYDEEELPIEAQQTWELLLSRPHVRIDINVLYSGLKQGVPKVLRGEIWNLLMVQQQMFHQGPRRKQNYPKFFNAPYEDMLKELTSQQHAILIDLGRTFPGHPYFTQTLGPGQLALFNILKAYSILDPEVGYCQGLSFVGGVLLLHVEEEFAYHLLKYLMYDKGCRKQYRLDLDGLQVKMYQLSRLVHDRLHDLYEHLEEHEVTPQLYAAPWFLTMFASQFPLNFVVRVFDLLFLFGTEALFCVAIVLLQTHQQNLLSIENFEEIMEYFKTSVPAIQGPQLDSFFADVCECTVKKEISAYEVEYQVLQEELIFTPQQDANINKLKEANKNLKKQNLDLLEQLTAAKTREQSLESSNQSLQQNQHHLEVRVRWLEMEKNNMRQVIEIMSRNATKDMFEAVPLNLERYLPHKASSPRPEDRKYMRRTPSPSRLQSRSPSPPLHHLHLSSGTHAKGSGISPPKEISISVPHQRSLSPSSHARPEDVKIFAPPPVPSPERDRRPRASTLDPKSMHSYFKSFIKAE